jgi:hypothetical protein
LRHAASAVTMAVLAADGPGAAATTATTSTAALGLADEHGATATLSPEGYVLPDPSYDEEATATSSGGLGALLTFFVDGSSGSLLGTFKAGPLPVSPATLLRCGQLATQLAAAAGGATAPRTKRR